MSDNYRCLYTYIINYNGIIDGYNAHIDEPLENPKLSRADMTMTGGH